MDQIEQIVRISKMESVLRESLDVFERLGTALEDYADLQDRLRELSAYYESPLWRLDLDCDEAGLLPQALPRGVLSQDAVYNLLDDERELLRRMRELAAACDPDAAP